MASCLETNHALLIDFRGPAAALFRVIDLGFSIDIESETDTAENTHPAFLPSLAGSALRQTPIPWRNWRSFICGEGFQVGTCLVSLALITHCTLHSLLPCFSFLFPPRRAYRELVRPTVRGFVSRPAALPLCSFHSFSLEGKVDRQSQHLTLSFASFLRRLTNEYQAPVPAPFGTSLVLGPAGPSLFDASLCLSGVWEGALPAVRRPLGPFWSFESLSLWQSSAHRWRRTRWR